MNIIDAITLIGQMQPPIEEAILDSVIYWGCIIGTFWVTGYTAYRLILLFLLACKRAEEWLTGESE